jgi:hypothetical protein
MRLGGVGSFAFVMLGILRTVGAFRGLSGGRLLLRTTPQLLRSTYADGTETEQVVSFCKKALSFHFAASFVAYLTGAAG